MDILFDQFSRYQAVVDVIKALGRTGILGETPSVLDVGCGPDCLLEQFLPNAQLTFVDPLLSGATGPNKIPGDYRDPSLDGKKYDVVIAIDTLEHIPAEQRQEFLERLLSLSIKAIIIAAPCCDFGEAAAVDQYVNERYRRIFRKDYPWLGEHFLYGLPSQESTSNYLKSSGWHVQTGGNGYTPWLKELLSYIICGWDVQLLKQAMLRVSRRFNEHLYQYDGAAPSYRAIIVSTAEAMNDKLFQPKQIDQDAERGWRAIMADLLEPLFEMLHEAEENQYLREAKYLGDVQIRDSEIFRLQAALEEQTNWAKTSAAAILTANAEIERLQSIVAEQSAFTEKSIATQQEHHDEIHRLRTALATQHHHRTDT